MKEHFSTRLDDVRASHSGDKKQTNAEIAPLICPAAYPERTIYHDALYPLITSGYR